MKITLQEYVKNNGQRKVAEKLGITQAAVSKAILRNREIYIFLNNGKIEAKEIRDFPTVKTKGADQ